MPPSAHEHLSDLQAPSSRWVATLKISRREVWWTFICDLGHTHPVARFMGRCGRCPLCGRTMLYVDDPALLALLRLGGKCALLQAMRDQHQGEW